MMPKLISCKGRSAIGRKELRPKHFALKVHRDHTHDNTRAGYDSP